MFRSEQGVWKSQKKVSFNIVSEASEAWTKVNKKGQKWEEKQNKFLPRSKTIIACAIFLPNKFEQEHVKYKNQKTNGKPENGR